MKDLVEKVKAIVKVFPESEVMIVTPDRSEKYQKIVDELKKAGVTGIWRQRKRKT